MPIRLTRFFHLLCTTAFFVSPLDAIAQDVDPALAAVAAKLSPETQLHIARNTDSSLQSYIQLLFQMAPNGRLTQDAVRVFNLRDQARQRNQMMLGYWNYDLDGDGAISTQEVSDQLAVLSASQKADLVLRLTNHDTDQDGGLSRVEIQSAVVAELAGRMARNFAPNRSNDLMLFDVDGDGVVTPDEIAAVVRVVPLLPPPLPVRRDPFNNSDRVPTDLCNAPKPNEEMETAFLSGRKGQGLSTLAVGGQDKATHHLNIQIAEGEKPLYIFAMSYAPQVWDFQGATDRIARLVIVGKLGDGTTHAAVRGADEEVITFIDYGTCFGRTVTKRGGREDKQITDLADWLGQDFDHIHVSYNMAGFQVPQGIEAGVAELLARPYDTPVDFGLGDVTYTLSNKGMARDGGVPQPDGEDRSGMGPLREMMRFFPAGLTPLDPRDVHSPTPISQFEILPQQAGLLQLIADGSLSYVGNGRYEIVKTLPRFPAGLFGAHGVEFILPEDVEMPAGDPGHSRVRRKATGECLSGPTCD